MLGDVHATHAANAEQLLDHVPVGDGLPDEWIIGSLQLQRAAVVRAVALRDVVLGTALQTDAERGHEAWSVERGALSVARGAWGVGRGALFRTTLYAPRSTLYALR